MKVVRKGLFHHGDIFRKQILFQLAKCQQSPGRHIQNGFFFQKGFVALKRRLEVLLRGFQLLDAV